MADDSQNHMIYSNQHLFYKTKHECPNYDTHPPCQNRGPYGGVKLTMKKSCNSYTNDKSKHKMCWDSIVFCQGMLKLRHQQTVSHMIKIYS